MDSILTVLGGAGEPLHYGEITRRIADRGLPGPTGLTPEATVSAYISSDIKRRGNSSAFTRVAKGTYALREWDGGGAQLLVDVVDSDDKAVRVAGVEEPGSRPLSFTDAAEHVLEEYGHGQPMHYRAIAEKALHLGLVRSAGKTPEASLNAQIIMEIRRATQRGDVPRFVKHKRGFVSLSRWQDHGLAFQIEQHNTEPRKQLLTRLRSMSPEEFEALVSSLLTAIGFEDVTVTGYSGDSGIDVRGTLVVGGVTRTRMAVQAKRWKSNVQAPIVQQVRGSLGTHEQGLIITTSDFSSGARVEAGGTLAPDSLEAVTVGVLQWNRHKRLAFRQDHIAMAWQHLRDEGWLTDAVAA